MVFKSNCGIQALSLTARNLLYMRRYLPEQTGQCASPPPPGLEWGWDEIYDKMIAMPIRVRSLVERGANKYVKFIVHPFMQRKHTKT